MWQLAEYTATFSCPPLAGRINLLEPWSGLHAPRWLNNELPSAASVLQIEARELIAPNQLPLDFYHRGADIVASYPSSEGRNVQTQIYWRVVSPPCGGKAAGLELIISAQTHLLDSRPSLTTVSTLPLGSMFRLVDGGKRFEELNADAAARCDFELRQQTTLFLFRPLGSSYSYAEMVHPSDFAGSSVERRGENLLRLSNQLFPDRLEKGVIRRSRVCGIFLSRNHDHECAMAAYHQFVDEPLPLTA